MLQDSQVLVVASAHNRWYKKWRLQHNSWYCKHCCVYSCARTKVLSGSGYSDRNPTPNHCPVFYCLFQQWSCALSPYGQRMAAVESRANHSVGNEWWERNLFLFSMIICSLMPWFGSLPTYWYSPRMLCALLWGMGWGECWSGLSHSGELDAVCPAPSDGSCERAICDVQLDVLCRLSHFLLWQSLILPRFIFQ